MISDLMKEKVILAKNYDNFCRDYAPSFNGNRLFIPLASSGCGIGCKYCYIPSPKKKVIPLSKNTLLKDIETAIKNPKFKAGSFGTVISLGCDTDPFASRETTSLTLEALNVFKALCNPIQLSTKCLIPQDIIHFLNNWPESNPKPIVYTSLTTISKAKLLEPNAQAVRDRIKNLIGSNGRWLVGIMIKPVLETTLQDQDQFHKLLSLYTPDVLIIGVRYIPQKKLGFNPHPFETSWNGGSFSPSELKFAKSFYIFKFPVFFSSLCATAKFLNSAHALNIYENYPNLCTQCGLCCHFV